MWPDSVSTEEMARELLRHQSICKGHFPVPTGHLLILQIIKEKKRLRFKSVYSHISHCFVNMNSWRLPNQSTVFQWFRWTFGQVETWAHFQIYFFACNSLLPISLPLNFSLGSVDYNVFCLMLHTIFTLALLGLFTLYSKCCPALFRLSFKQHFSNYCWFLVYVMLIKFGSQLVKLLTVTSFPSKDNLFVAEITSQH